MTYLCDVNCEGLSLTERQFLWNELVNVVKGLDGLFLGGELEKDIYKASQEVKTALERLRENKGPIAPNSPTWDDIKVVGPHALSLLVNDISGDEILSCVCDGSSIGIQKKTAHEVEELRSWLIELGYDPEILDCIDFDV